MKIPALSLRAIVHVVALSVLAISNGYAADKKVEILNASYDVARELFEQINPAFAAEWKSKTGETVVIKQSHGGSTRQARAVLEGLPADVVTFNQFTDIQVLQTGGYVGNDWQQRLPNNASPYYSFPAFLVRAGNPKKIHDWNDLVRANVQSIFPNPKTSGNGRYTYLGAYAYALEQFKGDKTKANEFVKQFLANVPVFDTGGRGATTTFVEREIGDVLVTFESEVNGIRREYGDKKFEVVIPSVSVQADFPVAVVDKVALRHGTRDVANAYLQFLYSAPGQEILAKNFNRVRDQQIAQRYQSQFPNVRLVTIDQVFGGWAAVTKTHFANGGLVDQALAR